MDKTRDNETVRQEIVAALAVLRHHGITRVGRDTSLDPEQAGWWVIPLADGDPAFHIGIEEESSGIAPDLARLQQLLSPISEQQRLYSGSMGVALLNIGNLFVNGFCTKDPLFMDFTEPSRVACELENRDIPVTESNIAKVFALMMEVAGAMDNSPCDRVLMNAMDRFSTITD